MFRGPFNHVLCLAVFRVFVFGDDACYVAGGVVVVGGSEVFCVEVCDGCYGGGVSGAGGGEAGLEGGG